MQQRNKMIRLATHHFFQMGKFLFPLYALLLTGEVLVSSRMFVQSCRMGALLSFQAIWWKPILPVMFYVAYAVAFFGILLYFMRFTMGGTKGVYTLPFRFMGGAGGRPYRLPPPGRASSPQPQWGKAAWGSGISALVSFWRLRLPIWRPVPCGCLGWLTGSAGKAFWIKMEGSK